MKLRNAAFVGTLLLLAQSAAGSTHAPMEIRAGHTVPLFGVYWISDCFSRFNKVTEIETFSGGELLSISINQPAIVRTHQCNNDVPGAWLYLTAKPVAVPTPVQLRFSVKYDTLDGPKADMQIVPVTIQP